MSGSIQGCVCVNGRFCNPHEATVSVFDAGFLLGDGLFESLRARDGVPYLLDRHLTRLLSAAAELEFTDLPSRDTLAEQVRRTIERSALPDAYVRVTVTRGSGAGALAPPSGPPTVVIAALPAPARAPAGGSIAVVLLRESNAPASLWQESSAPASAPSAPADAVSAPAGAGERGVSAKSTSRQPAVLARRLVDRLGAGEGLYVSRRGRVLEGVASNVFVVAGGTLVTPPVEDCLPGITRARLLELARGAGLTALEAPVELAALMGAEEVFVTNAVQGPRRVGAIDGAALATATTAAADPGGVFATLLDLYEADRAAASLDDAAP